MADLWTVLLPILVADMINPVLFAFMVYAAGSNRPISNTILVLLGHTAAYLSAGVALAFGMEQVKTYFSTPHTIDFVAGLLIGLLLLWVAYLSTRKTAPSETEQNGQLTPLKAFGIGATINFIGLPFALPYFAAIDQILIADLNAGRSFFILLGYNLLYALPFVIVPALVLIMGQNSRPLLEKINNWLDRGSAILLPIILGLVGLGMVADAVSYFVTGKGLW